MVWGGCSRVMWGQPIRGQEVVKWKEKDSVGRWKTGEGDRNKREEKMRVGEERKRKNKETKEKVSQDRDGGWYRQTDRRWTDRDGFVLVL